jgi:hypothetical protein
MFLWIYWLSMCRNIVSEKMKNAVERFPSESQISTEADFEASLSFAMAFSRWAVVYKKNVKNDERV